MTSNNKQPYITVLTICIGFLVIYALTLAKWPLWVALSVSVLGASSSYLAKKIHKYWMQLGTLLSFVIPPVLLSIIFYCLLYPIALLSRIFGEKDPLGLKNTSASTFQKVTKQPDEASFHKPW